MLGILSVIKRKTASEQTKETNLMWASDSVSQLVEQVSRHSAKVSYHTAVKQRGKTIIKKPGLMRKEGRLHYIIVDNFR